MIARILRGAAVTIAVVALLDPPVTMAARGRPRLALIANETPDTIPQLGRTTLNRLARDLRSDFDIVNGPDEDAAAAIVVGTDYPEAAAPEGQRVYTVTTGALPNEPDVRVTDLRVAREVPPGTLIHLEIAVDAVNAVGASSTLVVRAGRASAEVARASHTWTERAERWRTSFDITPLDASPWRLHVNVSAVRGERALSNNTADALVAAAEPLRVLIYEPRPSWAAAFVRRALENDSRFDVGSVTYPSRAVRVTSGDADTLQSISLNAVRAIVVGGLDRLTAADARVLDRFMREREGSVVLLPDSLSDVRAVAQWLSMPVAAEVLLEKPAKLSVEQPVPPVAASEMLTFSSTPGQRVLARSTGSNNAVVTVLPVGAGRLLVSGALDAWRYRADDDGAFDRFWRASVAGVAMASPPEVDLQIAPPVVSPGQRAEVRVRVLRAAVGGPAANPLRVSSTLGTGEAVRLWPEPALDTFRGVFVAPQKPGAGRLTVAADRVVHAAAAADLVVVAGARAARPAGPPLALLSATRGGIDVTVERVSALEARVRRDIASPPTRVERHPMRAAWWLLPFVGCLSGDWWLRRRRGLR